MAISLGHHGWWIILRILTPDNQKIIPGIIVDFVVLEI
jgi:hypothetical protein